MGKIIIVDDEKAVAEVICKFLQIKGFNALCFNYPREVLLAITEKNLQADVLVTDNDMPGIKGIELVREVKEIFPEIRVVLISGKPIDSATWRSAGCDHFFMKPVTFESLATTVATLLLKKG